MRKTVIYAAAIVCVLIFGLTVMALARQAETVKTKAVEKINRSARRMNPTTVRQISYRISGRISAVGDGHLISGRSVKIILRKGRQTVFTQTKTLDTSGACSYQFLPRFPGDYTLTIQKVATSVTPSSTLNVCFDGTIPASRSVTLNARSRTIGSQDFSIRFSIAFDRHGLCW